MRRTIIDAGVTIDRDRSACPCDSVVNCAACVVVVACDIGEAPRVSIVRAGIGVCRSTQGETVQVLAVDSRRRSCSRVRVAIVSHTVGCDADRRVGLGDLKVLRVAAAVVVRVARIGVARRGRARTTTAAATRRTLRSQIGRAHV